MEPTMPKYKSAILRQQVVQIATALIAIFGVNVGDFDVDATFVSIFAGITGLTGLVTLLTRLFKPSPNLTVTAAEKERELVRNGELPSVRVSTAPLAKQGGFARATVLMCLALIAGGAAFVTLPGCTNTKAAYETARASDNAIADTAYVVAEHYAAVVKEAADLAALPNTSEEVKDAMKAADRIVKPLIIGDPVTGRPGLRQLSARYMEVRSATNGAELQAAINRTVVELSQLIAAVKAARSPE